MLTSAYCRAWFKVIVGDWPSTLLGCSFASGFPRRWAIYLGSPCPVVIGFPATISTRSCAVAGLASGSQAQNAGSRRPPRKSTLTQQQKNQKRQRATQDQLVTLEMEFNKNPTPTAAVRERIAEEINMTERSVQIWFQNR